MTALPFLKLVLYLLVVVINSILAVAVYRANKKSATNIIFVLLSVCTSLWLVVMYLSTSEAYLTYSLPLIRMSIFFAVPQSVLFFLLSHTIPSDKLLISKKFLMLIILLSVIMMSYTLTPWVFREVAIVNHIAHPIVSRGIIFFSLFAAVFSLSAILLLIRKVVKMTGIERLQIRFMLVGICCMLGLIIATILIPIIFLNSSFFVQYAWLYVLFFLILTAISILRYRLFDIKILTTELFSTILVLVLIFEGASSNSFWQVVYKLIFSALAALFGYFLVKSVKKEIKQREQLERLSQKLKDANVRLQELDRQKTEFLSIASHQLRTPLSIIKGYIELIKDGGYGKVTKQTVEVLDNMDESNQRLVNLVDDFLNITRIEQGRTKYAFEKVNINEMIESVVKELALKADQKGLKLIWHNPSEKAEVTCDQEKVRNVVFNFVDNAIKYTEKGAVKAVLDVQKDGVVVRIKDTGYGFGKEDEVNFFQKFYRGKNVIGTNVTGTGLGIYVCRKFIEAHGGEVWAHSKGLREGSEFGFWIPFVPKQQAGSVEPSTASAN